MVQGLIVMKWSDRSGVETLGKYPGDIVISDKTLLQVFSTHEYSGQLGMISLMIEGSNIASYFFSKEKATYLVLLLGEDEEADSYEEGLVEVSRVILANYESEKYLDLLPSLYKLLANYPTLNMEQQLAIIYLDEIKRHAIQRLREEGAVTRSELEIWLKDISHGQFLDLDGVIHSLLKAGLVKGATVQAMPDVLFLTRDIAVFRTPPVQLFAECTNRGLPNELKDAYGRDIKKYFTTYQATEEDNLTILSLLTDLDVYEILLRLRESILQKENELNKTMEKVWETQINVDNEVPDQNLPKTRNINEIMKKLWDAKVITVLQNERGTEFYCLRSDIVVKKFFAEYMLQVLQKSAKEHSKADFVLLEHLNVLEDTYKSLSEQVKRSSEQIESLTL